MSENINIREYLDKIVIGKHERGFQKHKKDSGNYVNGKLVGTNWGISAPTLASYLGREPTMKDMKNLKKETALNIYEEEYVKRPGFDKLPKHLQRNIIDMGINASPGRAIKILQKLGGVKQDGILGPNTIKAIQNVDNNAYVAARKNFYSKVAKIKPEKSVFLKGWLKRAESFKTPTSPTSEATIEQQEDQIISSSPSELENQSMEKKKDLLNLFSPEKRMSEEVMTRETAPKSYDQLSFKDAFHKAYEEKGKGATFAWKGKEYLLKKA